MKKLIRNILLAVTLGSTVVSCASKQSQESVGQYVDGSITTTSIKSKMLSDPKLKNTAITVTTYQGTVQLSGFVNNAFQKVHANAVAMHTEGVQKVENSLIIKK